MERRCGVEELHAHGGTQERARAAATPASPTVALAYHRRPGRHDDVHIRAATGAVNGRGVEYSDVEPLVVEHLDIEHFDVEHLIVKHFDVEHFDVRHLNLWQALLRARPRRRDEGARVRTTQHGGECEQNEAAPNRQVVDVQQRPMRVAVTRRRVSVGSEARREARGSKPRRCVCQWEKDSSGYQVQPRQSASATSAATSASCSCGVRSGSARRGDEPPELVQRAEERRGLELPPKQPDE